MGEAARRKRKRRERLQRLQEYQPDLLGILEEEGGIPYLSKSLMHDIPIEAHEILSEAYLEAVRRLDWKPAGRITRRNVEEVERAGLELTDLWEELILEKGGKILREEYEILFARKAGSYNSEGELVLKAY